MSALTDRQRREEAKAARYERARGKLDAMGKALAHWMEGLSAKDSGERLGVTSRTIEKYRQLLELTRRRVDADGKPRGG